MRQLPAKAAADEQGVMNWNKLMMSNGNEWSGRKL